MRISTSDTLSAARKPRHPALAACPSIECGQLVDQFIEDTKEVGWHLQIIISVRIAVSALSGTHLRIVFHGRVPGLVLILSYGNRCEQQWPTKHRGWARPSMKS